MFLVKQGIQCKTNQTKTQSKSTLKPSKPQIINQEICMGSEGTDVLESVSCCICGREEAGTQADYPEPLHVQ